jgi:SAM-dependent methyltransferase
MLVKAFLWLADKSPRARRWLFRNFFDAVSAIFAKADWWTFLNYGYANLDGPPETIALEPQDESERYGTQMYHHVASAIDLTGKEVLEISCGRGGGASYIARYLGPKRMAAVDIAAKEIAFCQRRHQASGLTFQPGDAEALPFPDASFDAVVNIEASFCYGDIEKFYSEVKRVLRPGGAFLYADLRLSHEVADFLAKLKGCGLELRREQEITASVVRASQLDSARRRHLADTRAPLLIRGVIKTFIGVEGTRIPAFLDSDRMKYFSFELRKAG